MSKVCCAVECFKQGFNCSQAILSTYSEQFGLDREMALKVSSSFGAGMGRLAETCGAVTGAFMLMGLKYGKYIASDNASKEKNYELVKTFSERFIAANGSIKCKELLNYDISTPEGMKNAAEKGLFNTLCVKYVKDAAEIIEELLSMNSA